jgi:hypothetical protein
LDLWVDGGGQHQHENDSKNLLVKYTYLLSHI